MSVSVGFNQAMGLHVTHAGDEHMAIRVMSVSVGVDQAIDCM
jgi:hypothetical protein